MRYLLIFIISLTQSSLASANCYWVFDSTGQVVYQSSTPPVDLSGSISQAVESKFPGGHLIIDQQLCDSNNDSGYSIETTKNPPSHMTAPDSRYTEQQRNISKVIEALVDQTPLYQEGSLAGYGSGYYGGGYYGGGYYGGGYYGGGHSGHRHYRHHGRVHARSYSRRDGTYVGSHYRSAPRRH